jgi:hypothetical protein
MIKKIYSQPSCLVVALGTMHILAESLPIGNGGGGGNIESPEEILTKENKDVNVWDKEW